jgi:hypothetical protein
MNNDISREFKGTDSVVDPDSISKAASGESPMTEVSETAQDRRAFNHAQILSALKAAGIALVTVDYSGCCCDDQEIDRLVATGPKPESGPAPEIALPEAKVTVWMVPDNLDMGMKTVPIGGAIEDLCWEELVYGPGWDGRDDGVFILDVARGTMELRQKERPLLGFQFCNAKGENIAGNDDDPSGLASFEILAPDLAIDLCHQRPKGWPYRLQPIYVGDIEEPNIVFANGLWMKC